MRQTAIMSDRTILGRIRGLLRAHSSGLSAAGYPPEVSGSPNTVSIVREQTMVEPAVDPSGEGAESHVRFTGWTPPDDPTRD